eukprot:gb/GEZN01028075.1/.p2 GENE.gb/GEZN01028075.1/~~gb/GEZN01028075.1/.p2  ORF type:complete len:123 (-),score=6.18 gb/GEZN01028075.1/:53-421(-)
MGYQVGGDDIQTQNARTGDGQLCLDAEIIPVEYPEQDDLCHQYSHTYQQGIPSDATNRESPDCPPTEWYCLGPVIPTLSDRSEDDNHDGYDGRQAELDFHEEPGIRHTSERNKSHESTGELS